MQKVIGILLLLGVISWSLPQEASARENEFQTVFKNGFYGGLVGALVGGALLLFNDDPGDNLDYITKGLAIGIIGGVAYGLYDISSSLAEIEDGTMTVGVPTPEIRINSLTPGSNEVEVDLQLLRWRF